MDQDTFDRKRPLSLPRAPPTNLHPSSGTYRFLSGAAHRMARLSLTTGYRDTLLTSEPREGLETKQVQVTPVNYSQLYCSPTVRFQTSLGVVQFRPMTSRSMLTKSCARTCIWSAEYITSEGPLSTSLRAPNAFKCNLRLPLESHSSTGAFVLTDRPRGVSTRKQVQGGPVTKQV